MLGEKPLPIPVPGAPAPTQAPVPPLIRDIPKEKWD